MYGIFVNERGAGHYARWIVDGNKTIETRNRDMLSALVGKRVAIVRTHRNSHPKSVPMVIGYVTIREKSFCKAEDFYKYFKEHLVSEGSAYDCHGKGKWFYHLAGAEKCEPYPLPSSAIRHGRSWCEFEHDASGIIDILRWADEQAEAMTDEEWKHLHDNDPRMSERELF